jgi:hypothetical protein
MSGIPVRKGELKVVDVREVGAGKIEQRLLNMHGRSGLVEHKVEVIRCPEGSMVLPVDGFDLMVDRSTR